MEQVRAQRASARHGAGGGMMRASRVMRVCGVALAAVCVLAPSRAAAQSTVELQSLRHGAPPRFDVDSAIARASALRRQNRRAAAAEVMRQAVAADPNRSDARALYSQLQQELHGGEAVAAVLYKSWRTQLPEWREGAVALRQNTSFGAAVVRGSHLERAALSDDKVEVEAYPAFPHGYLALGGGVATHATLYAHTSASAELYASPSERVEGSVGYRRMNFTNVGVDMLGGSLGTYVGNNLLGARVTHVTNDGGTSVLLSARRFLSDDGQYLGLRFATGTVPVELRTPTDFAVRFSQSVGADVRVFIRGLVVLSADGELGRDGLAVGGSSEYSAVRVGLGVRY
jgi:YaiO family outer membrane protein